ncbi:DnaA/Hda family protein [Paradesulfitobacterium ferrireducens]|uniref:DnaA/Hda family protein n=1 Tax=Paradesulfitobacterium ferrireducens TaxID=2816476 RepID=UPI001A90234A|nr:helix-turn-helix domain-containing protein [Paradesulfitobacterium ferrireducens]
MDYFVSEHNMLAYRAVAEYHWASAPQSLLIYGHSGVGKTKLLALLASKTGKSGIRAVFQDALAFSRQYSLALQENTLASVRARWRSSQLLVLDGLEGLKGRPASIEELYHTYEHLGQQGGKMVFSLSAGSPNLVFLGTRFASRIMSGMVIGIDLPASWEIEDYLEFQAHRLRLILEPGIISDLSRRVQSPAEAREALHGFIRFASLKQDALTASCFHEFWQERLMLQETALHPDNIMRFVAEKLEVPLQELKGASRKTHFHEARQIAMYLIRTYTNLSYSQIGDYFGRGHTAILDACRKLEDKARKDAQLEQKIRELSQVLVRRRDGHRRDDHIQNGE